MVEIFQNIRQFYGFAPPCEELADYVEFFAESFTAQTRASSRPAPAAGTMFASWTPTFYINLGTSYALELGRSGQTSKARFIGQQVGFTLRSKLTRHLTADLDLSYFVAGRFLAETGEHKNILHVAPTVAFTF